MKRQSQQLIRIGTAGWAAPRPYRERRPATSSALTHYATYFNCVEINSSFYRLHRRATYERWAAATESDFRFAVKMPRAISHERVLRGCRDELEVFLSSVAGLGGKLAALLLQLPPRADWDARVARRFLDLLRALTDVPVVCEPRHPSWSAPDAERVLTKFGVSLVCADPSRLPRSWDLPGRLRYYRLHGSPRVYWSSYPQNYLAALGDQIALDRGRFPQVWCIFDNTAAGAAWSNAEVLSAGIAQPAGRLRL